MTNELAGGINRETDVDEGDLKTSEEKKKRRTVTTCLERLAPK